MSQPPTSPWLVRPLVMDDLIAEQHREIALCEGLYADLVARKRLSRRQADHQLLCKREIAKVLAVMRGQMEGNPFQSAESYFASIPQAETV